MEGHFIGTNMGLVERFNRTLIEMLSKWVDKKGRDWDQQLPYVLWAYRVSPHNSTGKSPFFLLHGYNPQLPIELALEIPTSPYQVDQGRLFVRITLWTQ